MLLTLFLESKHLNAIDLIIVPVLQYLRFQKKLTRYGCTAIPDFNSRKKGKKFLCYYMKAWKKIFSTFFQIALLRMLHIKHGHFSPIMPKIKYCMYWTNWAHKSDLYGFLKFWMLHKRCWIYLSNETKIPQLLFRSEDTYKEL